MAKFETNASGAIWWPNLQLMQVALYLAGEITQVKEPIPWVRCASGNVLKEMFRPVKEILRGVSRDKLVTESQDLICGEHQTQKILCKGLLICV